MGGCGRLRNAISINPRPYREQKKPTKTSSSNARNNHPDYLRTMAIVEFIDQTIFSIVSFIQRFHEVD
jgi:hypothetical protein